MSRRPEPPVLVDTADGQVLTTRARSDEPTLEQRKPSPPGGLLQALRTTLAQSASSSIDADATARLSFEDEADRLLGSRGSRRSRRIVHVALAAVAALIAWAALAKVDEVTRGDGRVIPSRQLQVVQSLDGGVVSEILVAEGQTVEAGQLLLRIDETRATSGVRESAAQGTALRVRAVRLRAMAEAAPFDPPKAKDADEQRVVDDERKLYDARRNEIDTSLAIVRQQIAQRQNELAEAASKRTTAQRAIELAQRELDRTKPLLATGAVSEVEVLRIERDVSRNRGDIEQAAAQMARANAAIGESQRKLQEVTLTTRSEARKELAEVAAKLKGIEEGSVALVDRVDKAQVKSPVRGRVQRLLANTIGGVITPGKDIVEIVPLDDALVLEARVSPRDIAFIRPDQDAMVKFTAYDFAIYGGLEAKVINISPDSVIDDKGNAFYLVRVRTTKTSIGKGLPIIPGMTAEVDVLTGRKSVLSYLLKPVLRVHDGALRER
jgi:membrane fusion protein, adhesin transport system